VDSWRKKYAINQLVLGRGGGLLMFLDADDWVDVRLIEAARALIGPGQIGAVIEAGIVTDFQSLRAAPLPHPRLRWRVSPHLRLERHRPAAARCG
jgi:hypothetical protein